MKVIETLTKAMGGKKWIKYAAAGVAALLAFSESIDGHNQGKKIEELMKRVSELENK